MPKTDSSAASTPNEGRDDEAKSDVLSSALGKIACLTERSVSKVEQELRNAHAVGKMTVTFGGAELGRRVKSMASRGQQQSPPTPEHTTSPGASATQANIGAIDQLIPGYDDLSASQVVKLLVDVSPESLKEINAHEESGRGRRTILNRIEQLQHQAG